MTVKEYNQAVESFSDGIFRFILKNIRDEERAKDIVQDTFEKLWIKLTDVNGQKVKSYLFSTAYHTMIDIIRKDSRSKVFDEIPAEDHSHSEQYSDLNEILHKALGKLPEDQR